MYHDSAAAEKKTVNFGELERELYAGRGSIEKELADVKKWFQGQGIQLEKKKGKGMEVFYQEFHYRMAVWQFIGYWKHRKRTGQEKNTSEEEMAAYFLDGFETGGVEQAVRGVERRYGFSFSYESHRQLLFLLSMMVSRIRKKHPVGMEPDADCRMDSRYDVELTDYLSDYLGKHYHVDISGEEKGFLLFLVRISDIHGFSDRKRQSEFENENLDLCCVTMKLANLLGEIINIDLKSDEAFLECLMLQLRSTTQRLRYHMVRRHPLLKQVKHKYPNIFAAVYAAGVSLIRRRP